MRVWFRLICPLKKTVLFHSMTAFVFHMEISRRTNLYQDMRLWVKILDFHLVILR